MVEDDWNPGEKYQMYLSKIQQILGEEERTVRDIYYALEARGFPEELRERGHGFDYKYVKRAVKKGRRHGYIDPEKIIDTSRRAATKQQDSHASPKSFASAKLWQLKNNYFENFWEEQPKYVEVWLEKAALESVFKPICDEHNVRLEATRGDWSDSKINEAAQRIVDKVTDGKDVKILYFGDYNPSGLHAPVSVQERMAFYGLDIPFRDGADSDSQLYFDIWPTPWPIDFAAGSIHFERVSLTMEEIERFDLPENPTPRSSAKDRTIRERFMEHASGGRDVDIELNALKEFEREYLEDQLEDAITKHIDDEARRRVAVREEYRQEKIADAIEADLGVLEDL